MYYEFQKWSHCYGSSNAPSSGDGSTQLVYVRGDLFGYIRASGGQDYIVMVGDYPNETMLGCFRTERKAQLVMLNYIWKQETL